jgi:hypothetical protein
MGSLTAKAQGIALAAPFSGTRRLGISKSVRILNGRRVSCLRTYRTPVARHCGQASGRRGAGSCGWGRECELADEGAVGGDDADVGAGDEQADLAVAMSDADRGVAELAEVAQRDFAAVVNAVLADAVMGWGLGLDGLGLEAVVEGY